MSISRWLRTNALFRLAQHEGACLMLKCPGCVKKHMQQQGLLKLPGAEPDNLHCTLVYLGPADKLTPEIQEKLVHDLEPILSQQGPQQLKLTGLGTFFPGDKGAPLVGLVDGLHLNQLRDAIEPICRRHLGALPDTHGFLPHVTLAYLPQGEPHDIPGIDKLEPTEWTADSVALVAKDKVLKEFPLRGEAVEGDTAQNVYDPQGVQYLTRMKYRNRAKDPYPVVRGETMQSISQRLRTLRQRRAETDYQKFFKKKLDEYEVKSPAELTDEEKKDFFDEVDKGWKGKEE